MLLGTVSTLSKLPFSIQSAISSMIASQFSFIFFCPFLFLSLSTLLFYLPRIFKSQSLSYTLFPLLSVASMLKKCPSGRIADTRHSRQTAKLLSILGKLGFSTTQSPILISRPVQSFAIIFFLLLGFVFVFASRLLALKTPHIISHHGIKSKGVGSFSQKKFRPDSRERV